MTEKSTGVCQQRCQYVSFNCCLHHLLYVALKPACCSGVWWSAFSIVADDCKSYTVQQTWMWTPKNIIKADCQHFSQLLFWTLYKDFSIPRLYVGSYFSSCPGCNGRLPKLICCLFKGHNQFSLCKHCVWTRSSVFACIWRSQKERFVKVLT